MSYITVMVDTSTSIANEMMACFMAEMQELTARTLADARLRRLMASRKGPYKRRKLRK